MFGPINKTPALLTPVGILIMGALYALLWFGSLDYRHLIPSDEGRYAEIAREMLVSGDWISPRYNDYKYFFKPPLQLWATVIAFDWFGVGEWQARLWGALTGFLTILFVGYTSNLTTGVWFGNDNGDSMKKVTGGLFGKRGAVLAIDIAHQQRITTEELEDRDMANYGLCRASLSETGEPRRRLAVRVRRRP